ncbi:restriction endonuclease subunit S [Aeromonas caviae]|uniref:restriction endonuclease subunit S n=1 Tax=Aeromonas caviae TaxID=648 RepID=UPI002AB4416E|nr:restriction endonuclease subunit S [Aeromonas caviae]MDY7784910.1 restriction endonuclease subunit S [Aeromonas caviae]
MTKSKLIEIDPLKLPADWCVSNIDSITSYIQRGKSPKYTEKSDLPVINQKCVRWDGIDRAHQKYVHPEQYDKWTSERFLVDGDILWNSTGTGTIGRAALVHLIDSERLVVDSHITIVRPAKGIEPKYLHYWIMGNEVQNSIGVVQSGSTNQVELSKEAIQATPIPLAPTYTQKIIVNKIEELFSHIDAGVEGLKQAKAKLQQYRQSVLKDAVTGKLTKQWREQNADKLEPASKLLARIIDERRANWEAEQLKSFEEKGNAPKNDKWKENYKEPPQADVSSLPEIPDSWTWTTITQLGELNRGKSKHRPRNDPSLYGGDYPFVQTGDVRAADGLLTTYKQTYSKKGLAQSRLWPKGTMCITIAANIAETAILGIDACFPDSVVGFIPQNENVSVEYIEFFFRTVRADLDRYAPATAQKNINLAILETVSVPLMSIEEQRELVLQVTEKLASASRVEATIDGKIKHSLPLKSSILAKAFSGELVQHNSKENTKDLLDKIKAEKEASAETKPKRSTKRGKQVNSGRKSLLTVLNEQSEPVKPDELMQLAGFSFNEVEEFYIELAEISEKVEQLSPDEKKIKNWPYEKESETKLKLKD